jgi:aryl-alcohol dehydrogenase-like predicted oxidoreductase
MHPAVTCSIPGGRTPKQVEDNAAAADLPPITPETMAAVQQVSERVAKPQVHQRW